MLEVPEDYCGISFSTWLDIFLEYGMAFAQGGLSGSAYDIIGAALQANVFIHTPEYLFLIHVCWFSRFPASSSLHCQPLMDLQLVL